MYTKFYSSKFPSQFLNLRKNIFRRSGNTGTRVTRACKIPNGINYALQPIMKRIRDASNFEKSWRFVSNFNQMSLEEHRNISSEFRPLFFGQFGIKITKA